VWDASRQPFLVSSIHRRKIVAVERRRGERTSCARTPTARGVSTRSRATPTGAALWATTAAGPVSEGLCPADSGRTAVLAYDLERGAAASAASSCHATARATCSRHDAGARRHALPHRVAGTGERLSTPRPAGQRSTRLLPRGAFGSPRDRPCSRPTAGACSRPGLSTRHRSRSSCRRRVGSAGSRSRAASHRAASTGSTASDHRLIAIQNGRRRIACSS
jgi:hypothetical protein